MKKAVYKKHASLDHETRKDIFRGIPRMFWENLIKQEKPLIKNTSKISVVTLIMKQAEISLGKVSKSFEPNLMIKQEKLSIKNQTKSKIKKKKYRKDISSENIKKLRSKLGQVKKLMIKNRLKINVPALIIKQENYIINKYQEFQRDNVESTG